MIELVGWAATAVFVGSYFARGPGTLRRLQMVGALLWLCYGLLLRSAPIIVANSLVMVAAAWTARRQRLEAAREP